MERPPIEAVLFDNDGTLVDSEAISNEVMVATLGRHGIELGLEEAVTRWSGPGPAPDAAGPPGGERGAVPEDFLDEFRAGRRRARGPRGGGARAAEVLRRPRASRAVVSNAPVTKIALCLRAAGLMEFIDERHLYSAYDVGKWKPDPASYLHAARSMARRGPERCAVVEDSVSGVEAGRAAGMRTFAFDHRGELPDWPDVERLEALADLLDRLGLARAASCRADAARTAARAGEGLACAPPCASSASASSTEIAAALGAADELVGISHECDFPAAITDRPVRLTVLEDQRRSALGRHRPRRPPRALRRPRGLRRRLQRPRRCGP